MVDETLDEFDMVILHRPYLPTVDPDAVFSVKDSAGTEYEAINHLFKDGYLILSFSHVLHHDIDNDFKLYCEVIPRAGIVRVMF